MNKLATRSVTGALFAIVMLGAIILGQFVFAILMLGITVAGMIEFLQLLTKKDIQPSIFASVIAGVLVYALLALQATGIIEVRYLLLILPLIFILFFIELWRNKPNPFLNIAFSIIAILYIAIPFGLLIYMFDNIVHSGPLHLGIVMGYFLIIWLNDTGAYFTGSLIGKHKLFERISPNKSWEGSIGGAIFAFATAWGLSLFFTQLTLIQWLVLASILIITGSLGDLTESLLKRSLGIKDSGNILPGHGGILDRFDAVLLSVPFVFVYLALF